MVPSLPLLSCELSVSVKKTLIEKKSFSKSDFSVLSLKCTQRMKMKQNQTFSHGTYSHLTSNLTSGILMTFRIKVSQFYDYSEARQWTYFHGAFSSLTSFFIAHKILKYFSGFYSWHLFILLQKWAQIVKLNEIKRYMCKSDSIFLYLWRIIVPCLILDMIYISKMNDNSSQGKSISFNFIL